MLALVVCLGLGLAGGAGAQGTVCSLPPEVDTLSTTLQQMTGRGAVAGGNMAYLRALQRDISRARIRNRLEASGMSSGVPLVMELLDRAEQIAATGAVADPDGLRRLIRNVDQMERLNCVSLGGQGAQPVGQTGGMTFADARDMPKNFVTRVIEPMLGIGAAVLIVLKIAVAIFLGERLFRWSMAYFHNTKACRIPATLAARDGSFPVSGLVTTLGRGGLRFQPEDAALFYKRLEEMPGGEMSLLILEETIPARVTARFPKYAHLRFPEKLSVTHQQELLQHSLITPFYIKKSRRRALNMNRSGL